MDNPPVDPIGKLATAAVALHELYTELIRAGFNEQQALWLLKETMLKNPST